MTQIDDFGDRMKYYERAYTYQTVPISMPLCVRIDGKGFSKFTKGFKKPFDEALTKAMIETTRRLVKETHANIGYVQSDEITLIYLPTEKSSEYLFGGKVSKLNSILASMASANFNAVLPAYALHEVDRLAYFDCRAWGVPNTIEASNVILWRVQDARKNSISAMMRWTLGHKEMKDLSGAEMIAKMKEQGHNWEDLDLCWKYGTFVKPIRMETTLTEEELSKIPVDKRPETPLVVRKKIVSFPMNYFGNLSLEERVNFIGGK